MALRSWLICLHSTHNWRHNATPISSTYVSTCDMISTHTHTLAHTNKRTENFVDKRPTLMLMHLRSFFLVAIESICLFFFPHFIFSDNFVIIFWLFEKDENCNAKKNLMHSKLLLNHKNELVVITVFFRKKKKLNLSTFFRLFFSFCKLPKLQQSEMKHITITLFLVQLITTPTKKNTINSKTGDFSYYYCFDCVFCVF